MPMGKRLEAFNTDDDRRATDSHAVPERCNTQCTHTVSMALRSSALENPDARSHGCHMWAASLIGWSYDLIRRRKVHFGLHLPHPCERATPALIRRFALQAAAPGL